MGTASEGSDEGGVAGDCGVGTIVWVRRRNGSWWPGRILGSEDFAESHVMSSRPGTPVKLLGREDASVDWYNLEKSKRVKPFRCGEFDAFIERAEASHSIPIKKREKYARREDAILHALELEKQQLEMQQESKAISCHAGHKTLGLSERESNHYSSEVYVSGLPANQESQTSSRKISSLLDECHLDHPLPIHRNRKVKTSISEDYKNEISTHINVEDVSPEVVKSKGKLFLSVAGGNSDITDDDHSDLLPHGGLNSGYISQAAIDNNFSASKRKNLLPGAINDNPAKKRKVLLNSTKLSVSHSFRPHQDLGGDTMPTEEHFINIAHDAQKNSTIHSSPDADDLLDYSSHSWKKTPADSGNAYQLQQTGCISNESTPSRWTEENDFDSSATDSELEMAGAKLRSGVTQPLKQTGESSIERGMSHWHLKGKRNNRIISKRLHEYADGKNIGGPDKLNVQFRETSPEGKTTTSYNIATGPEFSSEKEIFYDTEEEMFTGLGNKRDDLERQHSDFIDSDDDQQLISEPGWGTVRPFQMWKAYWEDPGYNLDQFYTTPFSYRMIPMLIDVDLKVQARYQGEHVPLVSLMSKLNGMAIVGHPVHIEVLEDGSTDLLLPSNEFEETAAAPPIWKTAKRTSMHRLPRSNADRSNNSFTDGKSQLDFSAPEAKKKRFYYAHRSASGRFQRKPLKTVNLSSSQKTRALSSFVSEKKLNSGSAGLGGLIEADGSMPLVTCIPTKVVFSRILESVGRPSAAVARRAIVASAADKGQF
ncbi:Uncharacterized protein MA16_Dca001160 [Dendrobium catenatum]|uniref:PWWP domain-containing protein n=1 Tax=Dendrobium catenatum TaxID=906689 RepID=A0A2I0WLL9_9ASPA|nr:Uncharacterized protein MA16_Dca001160 [Dendrobium catenatum]